MGCENNCVNEHRIKNLEEDLRDFKERNSKDHKEFYNRLEDVEKDKEGLQTMRNLARNMTFLMKSIALGKEKYGMPKNERGTFTNFTDGL